MSKTNLNEQEIQKRLSTFFASGSVKYNVDNLYIFDWESDKILETKSGYIYEFEIKISKSDFKHDFTKVEKHAVLGSKFTGEKYMPAFHEFYERNKKYHPELTVEAFEERNKGYYPYFIEGHKMPNYFYYAVPEGMISENDVPKYAGLIYIPENYGYRIIKKAPQLHKEKYTDGELNLAQKFYYNWANAKERLIYAVRREKDLQNLLNEELNSKGQEKTYSTLQNDLKRTEDDLEYYKKHFFDTQNELFYEKAIARRLHKELKKLNPEFDIKEIEDEVDKMFNK